MHLSLFKTYHLNILFGALQNNNVRDDNRPSQDIIKVISRYVTF